ncbi:Pycsar system effector family protein [Nonomuraea sp. CA-143628]|uniref:Pycsar system effector family protein n=1 Tax=Nonomuraea sp. CA-143628 TaxID=3239997 RepID=UPI003D8E1E43
MALRFPTSQPDAALNRAIGDSIKGATERATADVDATLARVDGKANMLLAFALGLASAVVALAVARPRIHPVAMVAIGGAGVMLAVAAVLLLLAVRPYIPRKGGTGFVSYARAADDEELKRMVAGYGFGHLRHMSVLAVAKYRTVRRAVDLVIAAVVVLVTAIPVGVMAA